MVLSIAGQGKCGVSEGRDLSFAFFLYSALMPLADWMYVRMSGCQDDDMFSIVGLSDRKPINIRGSMSVWLADRIEETSCSVTDFQSSDLTLKLVKEFIHARVHMPRARNNYPINISKYVYCTQQLSYVNMSVGRKHVKVKIARN